MPVDSRDTHPHPEAPPVVCAVAEHGSPAAVVAAADEAVRLGARLHLVHVTQQPDTHETDKILIEAFARARAAHPDLEVTRDPVETTWVAAGLADAGRGATYVVVEQTHRGRLHRLLSGSTADGVAFKVAAPVLGIPHGWASDPSGSCVVTVGVQNAVELPALVRAAASEADARSADLVVLHAASPPQGFDPAEADLRTDWVDRAHHELDPLVQQVAADYPHLKVRLDVVLERPADALVAASSGSALLVLGRRHHDHVWGTHVGPVVRRALLGATCPVLLTADLASEVATDAERALEEEASASMRTRRAEHRPTPGDVVVAVGDDDAGGSVRFAVAEAAVRGVGVHLVHVVRMPSVDGMSTAEVWRDAVAHGRTMLSRAAEQARAAGSADLRVTHHLVDHGSLVHAIVAEGREAGEIVVQHRRLGRAHRLLTWSVTSGVAARADVPVIAVPAEWSSGPERVGCVVVGLQDRDDVEHVLPTALGEAERRGLALRVVHAGRLSQVEQTELTAAVEDHRLRHPDVVVHRVFEDEDAVDLLVGAMTAAELVVVGRRRHGLARRSHLGPVARSVLDESTYPVLLAPPEETPPR